MAKNQRPKVGLVFDDSLDSNDGVARYVKTLGSWLSAQGHEVCYLVGETKLTEWAGGRVYSLAKNQTVVFNGNRLSMPLVASRKQIDKVISSEGFDLLHVMVPYSPLMAAKVINAAGPTTAVVGTFHIFPSGLLSQIGSRLLKQWLRPTLRRFGTVVSVSDAAAEFARSAYGLQTDIIPNMVELSKFKVSSSIQANRIVFLGRLVKRKGAAELINAFALLKKRAPAARLTIGGDGPQRKKLEKLTARLGISDSVTFNGFIDEASKPAFLAEAAIACFPSLYGESFGMVLIEAMAAGAGAVLAGNNPGYRSVVKNQPILLVDPKNTHVFAYQLETLLSDRRLTDGLRGWQLNEVRQYDVNVVGKQILELYNRQIARCHKKSNNIAYGKP